MPELLQCQNFYSAMQHEQTSCGDRRLKPRVWCRWREVQKLAEKKPVVASMGDVAGSGARSAPSGLTRLSLYALLYLCASVMIPRCETVRVSA